MNSNQQMADFLVGLRQEFLVEVTFLLEQCEESFLKLDDPDCRRDELARIFRVAHTIKGSGAAVGFDDLATFAHAVEDCLSLLRTAPERLSTAVVTLLLRSGDALRLRVESHKAGEPGVWAIADLVTELTAASTELRGPPPSETAVQAVGLAEHPGFELFDSEPAGVAAPAVKLAFVQAAPVPTQAAEPLQDAGAKKPVAAASVKIDVNRIDSVLDLVGELVVIKSQLVAQAAPYGADLMLAAVVSHLDKTVRDLQDKALGMRMTPLKPLFLKLQRLVRDIALKLDKPIELVITGEDTELDRTTVELLADPLMHIMRNAIDHGIESRALRLAAGKPEKAVIRLSARQIGSRVVVQVGDDGSGIARDKVLRKAIERGLVSQEAAASCSDSEVYNLIFAPGFSTAEAVTDLSGRGVGLDVVRTNMQALKGSVEVASRPGLGSTFDLSTPLTASITDGIVVKVRDTLFIVPIDGVKELIKSNGDNLTQLTSRQVVMMVRDHLIPLVGLDGAEAAGGMVVVVESNGRSVGLAVDSVLGQVQVVLKPVPEAFGTLEGMSGVAVMGNGQVAMVVDIDGLLRAHQSQGVVARPDSAANVRKAG